MFKPCLVFPCYNHAAQFERFLPALLPFPCAAVVVDDGSDADEAARLENLAKNSGDAFTLLRAAENGGKGAAMRIAFKYAKNAGFTHVFQIDADGQHDPAAIKTFLEAAEKNPGCAVFGVPVYDESVPFSRKFGRKITNFFVALETFSLGMRDALCGFRVYPVAAIVPFLRKEIWRQRMGFDVRILVEMHWAGTRIRFLPVPVAYPPGGRSHFSPLRGNVGISLTHASLCLRLPFHLRANFRMFRR